MSGSEILGLARRAGVGPGVRVLDLCCGVAGPGRLVAATLGCRYLGVDRRADAVDVARDRAVGLDCRFEAGTVPPVRFGTFDVVLLLEAFLAFPDKPALLREVSRALSPGGRFAFTVEVGRPLTEPERGDMPGADTVWPVPLAELVSMLTAVGLDLRWTGDGTRAHRLAADALADAFEADRAAISAELGEEVVDRLVASHRLWSDWMATGRIRKVAGVAQLVDGGAGPP
ncbi:SAM-dependent methyltransferase [Nocardioides sp. Soil805]|nr:SAM-dependent methyltransferase [Nocardioides sp. Soil805]